MTGIHFVTDERGRKVAVQIDLKKHGARLQDFWDGLISESRRKEKGVPIEEIKAGLIRSGRARMAATFPYPPPCFKNGRTIVVPRIWTRQ
jgi:hypothetical protein